MGRLSHEVIQQWYHAVERIRAVAASQHAHQSIPVSNVRQISELFSCMQKTDCSLNTQGLFPLPSFAAGPLVVITNDQASEISTERGHAELIEDDQSQQAASQLPEPKAETEPVPAGEASWAHIASLAGRPQVTERPVSRANREVRHNARPPAIMHAPSRRATALGGVAEASSSRAATRHTDNNGNGILEDGKAGIVVIKGPIETIKNILSYTSVRIIEGAIYDISINKNEEIVVIFQYALHAQIFVDRNTESVATRGESVFGPGDWAVTLGKHMEWTDTLRRMAHPHRERRRLTFVKSRLFADNTSFMKWVREVQDVAGSSNVDFVWAFNTGNGKSPLF